MGKRPKQVVYSTSPLKGSDRPCLITSVAEVSFHLQRNQGFPAGAGGKESACQCRNHKRCRTDPWVGKTPGVGNGTALQYSCLENSKDRGDQQATVYGATESDTTEHTHTYKKSQKLL